ncbi:winged helix-turn-helix transcriptional regulator [Streptomyces bathyalis]|uniref:Winged helix-turn-helix transcriptional regulator n=1 Tax=Streptomyces bathyalis TaxID=2710756 RepID=A0A7T1T7J6_9ACTN|nr:metalloregulator ArsR/SmtB family transcription factor [Streptomyces bathyalis]QPP07831.1 winged helix-turn-helix transcriptional regulator [Streptomyces bathyalis]
MVEPDDLDELLRAVASRHRRRILFEVWRRERGAGELTERLGLAPASVSEHLKVLRKTGLVTMRADGTYRLYRACPERLCRLTELIGETFPAATHDEENRHAPGERLEDE